MIFTLKNFQKEYLILKIICFAWFIAKLISFKTWISNRHFPVISVFDFLINVPNYIHVTLYIISLIGLILVIIYPHNKKIVFVFLIFEIFSCLLDQMRWQPWEYQYILTFLFFLLASNNKHFIQLTSLLFIATYFYSGIHKLNGGFLTFLWENMILNRMFNIPRDFIQDNLWIHYLGILLALLEIGFGLGLLLFKKKKIIVFSIIAMHIFILILIGPISNYNPIVWPWNIAMIALVYILFIENIALKFDFSFFKNKLNLIIILVLFVMPMMSKFGHWYNHFSFNLYSGNLNRLTLCIENFEAYPKLENYKRNKSSELCNNYNEINVFKWSMNELKTPINSDLYTYKHLKKSLQKKYPNSNFHLYMSIYPYKKENNIEIK